MEEDPTQGNSATPSNSTDPTNLRGKREIPTGSDWKINVTINGNYGGTKFIVNPEMTMEELRTKLKEYYLKDNWDVAIMTLHLEGNVIKFNKQIKEYPQLKQLSNGKYRESIDVELRDIPSGGSRKSRKSRKSKKSRSKKCRK